jgi:hypothetical protein
VGIRTGFTRLRNKPVAEIVQCASRPPTPTAVRAERPGISSNACTQIGEQPEKHGGEAAIIEASSRNKVRVGTFALAIAGFLAVITLLVTGRPGFAGSIVLIGVLSLYRGFRQRRLRSVDSATMRDLTRRA